MREVLQLDPTLLWRADYLATYPGLAAFLEQHPEVAHNPGTSSAKAVCRKKTETIPRWKATGPFAT